jgi:hypothetical protein
MHSGKGCESNYWFIFGTHINIQAKRCYSNERHRSKAANQRYSLSFTLFNLLIVRPLRDLNEKYAYCGYEFQIEGTSKKKLFKHM